MKQLIFLLVLLCALVLLVLSAGTPIAQADSADNDDALPGIISASSTIEEMAAFDAAGPAPESQVVPFNETPGALSGGDAKAAPAAPRMLPETAGGGGGPGPGPISGAPPLVTNFIGVLDDGTRIPPDTMGAVGPNHIVEFLNTGFTVFDRTGVVVSAQITLQAFWAVLGVNPGSPASWPYDPKILYDQYVGRWVVTADGNPNARDGTNASWVLVGISQSSDPTLGWNLSAINPDAGATTWSDYPGLGIDGANVYVTNNMYTIATPPVFSVAKFWVISKAAMMAGNIVGQFSTFTDTIGTGTWQPCHSFDASAGGNNYIVTENWVDNATRTRRFLRIQQFAGVGAAALINTFGGNSWLEVNQYNMNVLDAPQMNCTTLINTNDSRLLDAVMRNGKIWTTHEVGIGSGITDTAPPSRPEVAWYECSPAAFGAFPGGVPIQQGRVSSPLSDDPIYYYYPSIAVNRDECVALGFSGSNQASYVSAYYTMRKPTDAAGYMDTVGLLKAGEAPYWKDWGHGRNRWGDFSATMVDPVDDLTFWTVQEYASNGRVQVPCVQDDGEWGTWWGSFECECAKWSQPPDTSENGIDIRCDRNDGMLRTLADDYLCTKTGPITDVRIWGSWKYDDIGVIDKFHLSIHDDIPADPCGSIPYSMPGNLLWSQDFTRYTATPYAYLLEPEWWWDPVTGQLIQWCDFQIWQYDIPIDLKDAFIQQGDPNAPIIYWLDLYVELDPCSQETEFGWKTSSEHWNDDAVWSDDDGGNWNELRYMLPHPLEPNSIDMAFEIATGEEEPGPKWLQPPDETELGMDIRMDRNDGIPRVLADDFLCTDNGLITGVRFWASWENDFVGFPFLIHLSIHEDIPADPNSSDYSRPQDPPVWEMDFDPTMFTEALYLDLGSMYEWWWDPYLAGSLNQFGDHLIYQYDVVIDPNDAFLQTGTPEDPKVYWLDIYVLSDLGQIGWKTSYQHWNDDAVYMEDTGIDWKELRYPFPHPCEPNSIDLAFMITTTPHEPPEPELDFSDAPEIVPAPMYPTTLANNGANHTIVPGVFLGAFVDPEPDGQPTIAADGDDTDGGDDEDGVTIVSSLSPGNSTTVNVVASVAGALDAWIDFGLDDSWAEAGDQIFNSVALNPGNNILNINVPASAVLGTTYARFRFSTAGGLPYDGPAPDGEVEDYQVEIILLKWSQPPQFNPASPFPDCFWGWDEISIYDSIMFPIVADDWFCENKQPIIDVHWWGSYENWLDIIPPGDVIGFHIGIWTDVPAGMDPFSHPGQMIWEWWPTMADLNEEYIGCDYHPDFMMFPDSCFRYDFQIPEDDWFYQEESDTIYWLSIAAVYTDPNTIPNNPWGWKTREHYYNDDAVRIFDPFAPIPGSVFNFGEPIEDLFGDTWDMAFELSTIPDCLQEVGIDISDPVRYAAFVEAGKPRCWCEKQQCHGNADNTDEGTSKTGYYAVGGGDLTTLLAGWAILDTGIQGVTDINGVLAACANFDNDMVPDPLVPGSGTFPGGREGTAKTGYYQVGGGDLSILLAYWAVLNPGVPLNCLPGTK